MAKLKCQRIIRLQSRSISSRPDGHWLTYFQPQQDAAVCRFYLLSFANSSRWASPPAAECTQILKRAPHNQFVYYVFSRCSFLNATSNERAIADSMCRRDFKIANNKLNRCVDSEQMCWPVCSFGEKTSSMEKPLGSQHRYGGDRLIFSSHRSRHAWETG